MKNTLLYYQGGGYSGCIWEWNFCFWDTDGEWHDLYSSGCAALDTEEKANAATDSGFELRRLKADVVDLTDAEAFRQFQQDNNAGLVLQIAQELNENYGYNIEIICSECGCSFVVDNSEYTEVIDDYRIICNECLAAGTCDCCNEYVGDTELVCLDNEDDVPAELAEAGYEIVCSGCLEYHKEKSRLQRLEDLRFQAFCTGEPDIFSEELREYWGA